MKRVGGLKEMFLTKETLNEAINHLTSKSKMNHWTDQVKKEWAVLLQDREGLVNDLYIKLITQSFKFSPFRIFHRYESKKVREIYASHPIDQIVDYVLDKCLKHALMVVKKVIHPHAYGSIEGKGQHELRNIVIKVAKKGTMECNMFALICDTKKYYPTIDQEILMDAVRKHIKDPWVLWLCDLTIHRIKGGKGLALGLATSNILGHLYHSEVDWYITQVMGCNEYYRFCDDKIVLSSDKSFLHDAAREIQVLVQDKLKQTIKSSWRVVNLNKDQIEFLGALICSEGARLTSYKRRHVERRLKKELKRSFIVERDWNRVLQSWGGIWGSLKGLDVLPLIYSWCYSEEYQEYFERVSASMKYVKNRRHGNKFQQHKP